MAANRNILFYLGGMGGSSNYYIQMFALVFVLKTVNYLELPAGFHML